MLNDQIVTFLISLNLFSILLLITIFWYGQKDKEGKKTSHFESEEGSILEAEHKSNTIIHRAVKNAHKLLVKAELEGIAFIAKQKLENRKVEADHQSQLRVLLREIKEKLDLRTLEAEKSYTHYLKSMEANLATDLEQKQKTLEHKIDGFFNRAQNLLDSFVQQLQGQTQTQLDKEIQSAKKIIEDYRQQRIDVIDENIVAILEKTLNITLGKKLTLGEQTQLVYEALEEAKKENFFA